MSEEKIVDLMAGTTRTLEAICRQLIDMKAINLELLLADLVQAQSDLNTRKVGEYGAVPAMLYAVLGGRPLKIDP